MSEKCKTVKLNVSDMHCCHCKAKVEAALKAVKGVKKVCVDLESATAEVIYRASETNPAALAAAGTACTPDSRAGSARAPYSRFIHRKVKISPGDNVGKKVRWATTLRPV